MSVTDMFIPMGLSPRSVKNRRHVRSFCVLVSGLNLSSVVCRATGAGGRRRYDVVLSCICGEHCLIVEIGNLFGLLKLRDDWTAQQVRPWLNQTVETLEGYFK